MRGFLVVALIFLLTGCSVGSTDGGDSVIDLTKFSTTVAYAEVENITQNLEAYAGKTIKGRGTYASVYHEESGQYFHYLVITDVSTCCALGLIFDVDGYDLTDYPEVDVEIEVEGVFIEGELDGQTYYYIAADDLSVLKTR